jgi:hypothetical protein
VVVERFRTPDRHSAELGIDNGHGRKMNGMPVGRKNPIREAFADVEWEFPVPSNQFPVPPKIFPVRSRREFDQKGQSIRVVRAVHQSQEGPESRKFPVFSLDNRECHAGE